MAHPGTSAPEPGHEEPLFALLAPGTVFAAAALALPLVGVAGALVALRGFVRARPGTTTA